MKKHRLINSQIRSAIFSINIVVFQLVLIGFSFLYLSTQASAQAVSSDTVSFQGKIVLNGAGNQGINVSTTSTSCVVSGADTCRFKVSYYTDGTGSTLMGSETFANVELGNYDGVFNLALGTQTFTAGTVASFTQIFTSGANNVYMRVEFAPDGVNLTENFGLMAMRATPFALSAKYIGGMTADNFVKFGPSAVQVNSSANSSIFINNTAGANLLNLQNSGSSALFVGSNGRVGIGTDSPMGVLHLKSSGNTAQYFESGGSGWALMFFRRNNVDIGYFGLGDVASNDFDIATYGGTNGAINLYTNGVSRMKITTGGDIGIGTTNPNGAGTWDRVLDIYAGNNSRIAVSSSAVRTTIFSHNSGYLGAPAGGVLATETNHPLSFVTNGASKMTILANGNVGIGTASPNQQLELTGNFRIPQTTATTGTIYLDGDRFIHAYKHAGGEGYNTFVGINSGNFTLTSTITWKAGYNTGVGYETLMSLTDGNNNVALGTRALRGNTTGIANVALGMNALLINTSGGFNVAAGQGSMTTNLTGSFNTAYGNGTLGSNQTGSSSTAIGYNSLYVATNSNNTALGFETLRNLTTGIDNTAVGYRAGYRAVIGSNNLFLGDTAGQFLNGASSGNVFIGFNTGPTSVTAISNQLYIHNNSGLDPLIWGDFSSRLLYVNGVLGVRETGSSPTYYTIFQGGDQAANITYTLPTASANGILRNSSGVLSWDTATYLTSSTAIVPEGNSFAAEAVLGTNDSHALVLETNDTSRVTIASTGNVGIGTSTTPHLLTVAGNIGMSSTAYLNFGSSVGSAGYGFRDNAGTLEFKNSAGSWKAFAPTDSIINLWSDAGTFTYLSSGTDDFVIGGTTAASNSFMIDVSANTFSFGNNLSANPILTFSATDGDTGSLGFNTNDAFYFSDANVGIGITNPANILEAYKSQNGTTSVLITNPNTGTSAQAGYSAVSDTVGVSLVARGASHTTLPGRGLLQASAPYGLRIESTGPTTPRIEFGHNYLAPSTYMTIDNGSVGIGIATPASRLHVVSAGSDVNALTVQDDARKIRIGRDTIAVYDLSNNSQTLFVQPGANTVFASGSGSVGIGLTPTYKLDVLGAIRTSTMIYASASGAAYLCGGDDACLHDVNVAHTVGIMSSTNPNYGAIQLGSSTTGSQAYIFGFDDKVGIGLTNPQYALEVDGDIRAAAGWLRSTGATGWHNDTYGGGWNMTDTTWIRSYGNKSIYQNAGTLRTDGTFQVGDTGATLSVVNSGNFAYKTNVLFANTSGLVGIGTATPVSTLSVYRAPSNTVGEASLGFNFNGSGEVWGFRVDAVDYSLHLDRSWNGWQTPALSINRQYGRVGFGLTSPGYRIDLPNTADVDGRGRANQWVTYSDARYKTDIVTIDNALSTVMQLRGVHYNNISNGSFSTGFIAQEVYTVAPELVSIDDDGYLSLDYGRFTPYIVQALQEQNIVVESLSTRYDSADSVSLISSRISALESQTSVNQTAIVTLNTDIGVLTQTVTDLQSTIATLDQGAGLGYWQYADTGISTVHSVSASSVYANEGVFASTETNLLNVAYGLFTIDNLGKVTVKGDIALESGVLGLNGVVRFIDSIFAPKITANQFEVENPIGFETAGSATVITGETSIVIDTQSIKANSKVLVTPRSNTFGEVLYVGTITEGESFTVQINNPQLGDIVFDWWIIDTVQTPVVPEEI